jgi:hypothetical protein
MLRRTILLAIVSIVFAIPQIANAQLTFFNLEGQAGAGLLPGNEVGGANSTGFGGATGQLVFDASNSTLSIDVGWGSGNGFSDLTGDVSAIHLHGPAGFTANAGVLQGLGGLAGFDPSATSGGLAGTVTLNSTASQALLNDQVYLNVHTADNPGGELRANFVVSAVPEPSCLTLLGIASSLLCVRRQR